MSADETVLEICAPKRGRPPRGSEGSRRREVLRAAEELFLDQGFEATSMDAVAKRAGVSKKTIYACFDTKEALFEAMMHTHMEERALPALPEQVQGVDGVAGALTEYLARLAAAILGPVAVGLFRLSVGEAPRFPAVAEAFYREGAWRHIDQLRTWLGRQSAAGLLRVDDPTEAAIMLTTFVILEPLRAAALGVRPLPTESQMQKRAAMAARLITFGAAAG